MTDSIAVVLTTVDSIEDADRLAVALLEKRLAACVQVDGPIVSHYVWEGKLQRGSEFRMMIKVARSAWPKLSAAIAEQHPYDEPQLIMLPVEACSDGYRTWIVDQTT